MKQLRISSLILILGLAFCASKMAVAGDRVYQYRQSDGTMLFTDRKVKNTKPLKVTYYGRPSAVTKGCRRTSSTYKRRMRDYSPHINSLAKKYEIKPDLIHAVIEAESCFNPKAVSRVGAQGLMQLMPGTAKLLGVKDPFNPKENMTGGVQYLRMMLDEFNQDRELALAAYNAGPGAVKKYGGVPPYKETRNYVKKIMARVGS